MTTTTCFSVQALESRLLLSASLSTTTTDPVEPDPGTIVAESWVPYVPDAQQTDVDIVQREGRAVAVVSIVFNDAGYRVTDWGTPQRDGNRFVVDAKVERWTGPSAQVITRVAHEYPLGELPPGAYVFDFNAWGKPVESETFTVSNETPPPPTPEQWIPYTPTEQQTTIDIYQREGRTIARVKIIFPDSGFRVDWGALTREGNTFRANAAVDRWTGPALTVMTPMVHEYVLGELPAGAYAFEFSARGTAVERKEFVVPEGPVWEPYQPTAEQTEIEIFQREGRWKARVKLTFNHNGYRVADWGTLRREGNTFIANAKVERTGGPLPVVTYASHEYDLGELLPGEHAFNFNAWSKLVERKAFVVPTEPTEEWVPYTPTAEQTEIRLVQEAGKTFARVTITFPDSGYRVDWGTVRREGNTFVADAVVDRNTRGAYQAITPKSHAYDLGELPAGEYVFEFRARGTLVESKAFHLFEDPSMDWVPYTPTPEQTEIDITQYQGKTIARVTVVFNNAGYRIDWGTLTRDGNTFRADAVVDNYLGPAPEVITPKSHEYVLGELSAGTYTFEFSARGEPVESHTFTVPVSDDLVINGIEASDEFRFFTDATGANILLFWNNDPSMRPGPLPIPRDAHDRFLVNTLGGDDTVVIDLVQHTPLPRHGMVYNGGAGADVLQITNALATDRIEIVGDRVVINGIPIVLVSVEKITIDRSTGSDLTVGGADVVDLDAGQHLDSITVRDDAVVRLTGDASQVSLSTLSVTDGGLLDLRDKTVMLTVPASEADAVMEMLHELVAAGRAGNWTGDRGITSSVAAESGNSLYGIGVATVPSPLLSAPPTGAAVLVIAIRYTLKGDLNLDGVVNADDYFRIDQGFLNNADTYAAGDVNYDGRVNADDYFAVDKTFLGQGGIAQSATTSATSAVAAAPSAARTATTPFSRARVTDDRSLSRRRRPVARVASDVL